VKGKKTGGRKAGTPNKATVARDQLLNEALEGEDPLRFLADTLKSKDMPFERRFAAAVQLAPYLHPKLSATDVNMKAKVTHEEAQDLIARVDSELTNGKAHKN